jgi:hypothetical protein
MPNDEMHDSTKAAPAAPARGGYPNHISHLRSKGDLRGKAFLHSVPEKKVLPRRSGASPHCSRRPVVAALHEESDLDRSKKFDLTQDSLSPSMHTFPARAGPKGVPENPERIGMFQRLYRGVQCV